MIEGLLIIVAVSTVLNSILLIKLMNKNTESSSLDSKLYDEQIKNYKRILRLNERYIKEIKSKGEQSYEQGLVSSQEQRRVY